jgi:hypothetical protein
MSTTVNVELTLFVAESMPRVLRALSDAMRRIVQLLSDDDHDVESHAVRSTDAVRAASTPSTPMAGPSSGSPPPPVVVPVLSGTLELRGTQFELDVRLVDRKRGTAVPPTRHVVSGALPRLASVLRCCQAALGALGAPGVRDAVRLLALLDSVDESIRSARQFLSRSAAVGLSVHAVVERAALHTVVPPTANGLLFDVMAEDVVLSVVAGFSDLALPPGATPPRRGNAAAWRALKARIRPGAAAAAAAADDRQPLRDRCRVLCESNVLRQVQTQLFESSATLNRARANLLALLSIERQQQQ